MSVRHEVEAVLRHWRDAERRLELAGGRDAEVIEREVAYYRWVYQSLSAAQTDAAKSGLHVAEQHGALSLSAPISSRGAD